MRFDRFGSTAWSHRCRICCLKCIFGQSYGTLHIERLPEALATYDEILNRNNVGDTLESEVSVADAMVAKGRVLVRMNCPEAALTVWDDVVRRFGMNDQPNCNSSVKLAQLEIAELLFGDGTGRYISRFVRPFTRTIRS